MCIVPVVVCCWQPLCSVFCAFLCFIKYLNKRKKKPLKMNRRKPTGQCPLYKQFQKRSESLVNKSFKTILKKKNTSLETKYKEMKCGLRFLHSTVHLQITAQLWTHFRYRYTLVFFPKTLFRLKLQTFKRQFQIIRFWIVCFYHSGTALIFLHKQNLYNIYALSLCLCSGTPAQFHGSFMKQS